MPMTPREVVRRAVRFEGADRIPYTLDPKHGTDIAWVGMSPSGVSMLTSGSSRLRA
jgi:hypothetical protein